MGMKIGFALTLYDKFDDLDTAIKIIRSWKHDYTIGVCCNHPQGRERVRGMDFDIYTVPEDVKKYNHGRLAYDSLTLRAVDSVRDSCKALVESSDCDYVVHNHSDAWFLDEEKLRRLVHSVDSKGMKLGCRGNGLEEAWHPFRQCNAMGQMDDHGLIFNRTFAEDYHVFDFKPEQLLYHKRSIHAMLALVFNIKIGLDKVWYYPYEARNVLGNPTQSLCPYNYDPIHAMVHVNGATLPYDWGKCLQANILNAYGYDFMSEYKDMSVYDKIQVVDSMLKRRMLFYGYNKKLRNSQPINIKKRMLADAGVTTIIKNLKHTLIDAVLDKMFPMPDDAADWYKHYGHIDKLVGKDNWTETLYDERI